MEKAQVTIVLADGAPGDRGALRQILEQGGYTIAGEAEDGVALIQLCQTLRPTAVFLDVGLPYLDGLGAAAYLRKEGLAELIFFLADRCDAKSLSAARALGAGGYLVKPVPEKQLLPAFAAALARNAALHRVRRDCAEMERKISQHRTLERAKCAVMEREGLTAGEAEGFLRRLAKERDLPLLRLAEFYEAMPKPSIE